MCSLHGAPSPAFPFLLKRVSTLLSRFIFAKVFWREVTRGGARRAGGEQDESSAVFTMRSLGGVLPPLPASSPLRCVRTVLHSEGTQVRRRASAEEAGLAGLLRSAVRAPAALLRPVPLLSEKTDRRAS